ncbi:MAG TPA: hypothetical protein PKD28_00305 [Candidatus Saccharibacteria bacterium]|nr:hypothetical protein [Candidatus Saccharibacteria bacterium]
MFFASLVLVGALVTATVISQPSYAAPEDYDNQSACEDAEYEWDGDASKCVEPAKSSCGIEGIGWVVCPVMDFLGGVADMAFNFLADSFLSIKVEYVNSASVESAWGVMRTLANVVFVIAFLVIIFSQLTSTGISNYGVKKLLPRLIIAAILVNMSLIICQIAVDISNILGYSLKTLFDTLGNDVLLSRPIDDPTGVNTALTGLGWATLIAALLAGGITLALSISGPVILAAVLALLLIALILVARIALITTLTIISPLAFVAFLLPNTEQWFKKWYKMFLALLMVFPIIAVVFGASALVAEVINQTATPMDASGNPTGDPNLLMQVIAMGVATVPLFLVPSLLKNSMSAAGSIGNKLSGWSSKANGRIGSKVRDTSRLGEAQRGIKNRMALRRATRRGNSRIGRAVDNSRFGKALGLDKGSAAAMAAVDKQDEMDVSQELTRFKNMNGATDIEGASTEMKKAIKSGDSTKARAMQRYLAGAGGAGIKELERVYGASSGAITDNSSMRQSLASDALGLGLKGKSAAIDSFSTASPGKDENGNIIQPDFTKIQGDPETYSRLGASELAGQKNLGNLMSNGLINQSMAQSVMGTESARNLMSVGDRETMAGLAGTDLSGNPLSGGGTGSSSPSPDTPAPSSGGGGGASGGGTPQISYENAPTTNINPSTGEVTTTSNFASGQEVMQQIHHASGHEGSATKKSLKAGVGNLSDAQLGELIQQAQTTPGAENDAHYQEVLKVARGEAGRRNGGPPPSSRP